MAHRTHADGGMARAVRDRGLITVDTKGGGVIVDEAGVRVTAEK